MAGTQADAVAQPQNKPQRHRWQHQHAGKAVELARHQQQPLAFGMAVGRHHGQVDEQPREVEQAGEPAGNEDDVEGLDPEISAAHW